MKTRRTKDVSLELIRSIVDLALDIKAENITILDMQNVANFCDYFIICTGNSDRQVKAIADGIETGLKDGGIRVRFKQGLKGSGSSHHSGGASEPLGAWVLLDLGDIVVHVFEPSAREFYSLEYLWRDAPQVILKKRISRKKTKNSKKINS